MGWWGLLWVHSQNNLVLGKSSHLHQTKVFVHAIPSIHFIYFALHRNANVLIQILIPMKSNVKISGLSMIRFAMMKTIFLNATLMVVLVATKIFLSGTFGALNVNAFNKSLVPCFESTEK